jgi:hypothetical protein
VQGDTVYSKHTFPLNIQLPGQWKVTYPGVVKQQKYVSYKMNTIPDGILCKALWAREHSMEEENTLKKLSESWKSSQQSYERQEQVRLGTVFCIFRIWWVHAVTCKMYSFRYGLSEVWGFTFWFNLGRPVFRWVVACMTTIVINRLYFVWTVG